MNWRRVILTMLVSLMLLPGLALAQCAAMWDVRDISQKAGKTQNLYVDGKRVGAVSTDWARSLMSVKQRIDRASGIQTQLLLCASADPNAFATIANGQNIVALTLGMGKLLGSDWDAYAAILGHENAHLVLGHNRETQRREAVIGLVQLFGSIALESFIRGNGGAPGWGSDLTSLGARLVSTAYSRDNEKEADREGIRFTIAAGFDPQGAIRLHQKLNSKGSFLSSHPGSNQRIAELQRTISELGAR